MDPEIIERLVRLEERMLSVQRELFELRKSSKDNNGTITRGIVVPVSVLVAVIQIGVEVLRQMLQ